MKSSGVTVKSTNLPSLERFLVSTLRPMRSKFNSRTFWILITSLGVTSSSILSITMPRLEYSRIELTSKILAEFLAIR